MKRAIKKHMGQAYSEWIQQARASGFSEEEIKNQLLSAGWNEFQIQQVLRNESAGQFQNETYQNMGQASTKSFDALIEVVPDGKIPGVFSLLGSAWRITKQRFVLFPYTPLMRTAGRRGLSWQYRILPRYTKRLVLV